MNERLIRTLFFLMAAVLLASCAAGDSQGEEMLGEITLVEGEAHVTLDSGLQIDLYELEKPPEIEPLTFVPAAGRSQEEVLALHEAARQDWFPFYSFTDQTRSCLSPLPGDRELAACEEFSLSKDEEGGERGRMTIEVLRDDEILYTGDGGDVSPISPLRGIWEVGGDWVLEYAKITVAVDEAENTAASDAKGQLVWNGVSLNEKDSLDEIFGFQTLNGRPFYFFEKDGEIGIVFDGKGTMLGFDRVPHYACCSAAELNPRPSPNMVSFFAQKTDTWYYVEIGVYQ